MVLGIGGWQSPDPAMRGCVSQPTSIDGSLHGEDDDCGRDVSGQTASSSVDRRPDERRDVQRSPQAARPPRIGRDAIWRFERHVALPPRHSSRRGCTCSTERDLQPGRITRSAAREPAAHGHRRHAIARSSSRRPPAPLESDPRMPRATTAIPGDASGLHPRQRPGPPDSRSLSPIEETPGPLMPAWHDDPRATTRSAPQSASVSSP